MRIILTEDERDEEESSSEDGDEGGIGFDELEDDESSSDDGVEINLSSDRRIPDSDVNEQTISQIFGDLYYYGSLESKGRRRRFKGGNQPRNKGKREASASDHNEKEDGAKGSRGELPSSGYQRPAPSQRQSTRGSCFMGTRKTLDRLTSYGKEDYDSEDEWLIIRVPKKDKKCFFVDYCDGDTEDEFQWLEGPYRSKHLTVEDLLDRRRGQTRTSRRRKGRTQFRNDEEWDERDKDRNLLPTSPCEWDLNFEC